MRIEYLFLVISDRFKLIFNNDNVRRSLHEELQNIQTEINFLFLTDFMKKKYCKSFLRSIFQNVSIWRKSGEFVNSRKKNSIYNQNTILFILRMADISSFWNDSMFQTITMKSHTSLTFFKQAYGLFIF